jgi:hypothetical protein
VLAVVLAEDDAFFRSVSHRLRLHRFSIIRYRDPVKLSDNLAELRPELLVVRHEDFPLHGELLASQLQYSKGLSDCPVCIFTAQGSSIGADAARLPKPDLFARLRLIEEDGAGSAGSSKVFSLYLSALSEARSGPSAYGNPSGSRLVAAAKREKKTGL